MILSSSIIVIISISIISIIKALHFFFLILATAFSPDIIVPYHTYPYAIIARMYHFCFCPTQKCALHGRIRVLNTRKQCQCSSSLSTRRVLCTSSLPSSTSLGPLSISTATITRTHTPISFSVCSSIPSERHSTLIITIMFLAAQGLAKSSHHTQCLIEPIGTYRPSSQASFVASILFGGDEAHLICRDTSQSISSL